MKELARPLTVVAHDAGAANHIFAWLGEEQSTFCLAGPARALWQARLQKAVQHPAVPESDLAAAVTGAGTVISGTGWESNLEHDARKLARERGIRSIAVLDHWTNYRQRFIRNGDEILPDDIWVSDAYAKQLATASFPNTRVTQLPNLYLENLVKDVSRLKASSPNNTCDNLLYVLEPIRQAWGLLPQPGEFYALNFFAENLHLVSESKALKIRLRPHPSDPPGKYNVWMARNAHLTITLDTKSTLAESLAWASTVVGCQTYAMVTGLQMGYRVFSCIPPWAPPCVLPHAEIVSLSALMAPQLTHN
jgi:hypothetical protein